MNAQDSYGLLTNNAAAKLSKGVTSTLKIKFEGSLVTLFVNGTQYYEGSLASIPNVEGKMGLEYLDLQSLSTTTLNIAIMWRIR